MDFTTALIFILRCPTRFLMFPALENQVLDLMRLQLPCGQWRIQRRLRGWWLPVSGQLVKVVPTPRQFIPVQIRLGDNRSRLPIQNGPQKTKFFNRRFFIISSKIPKSKFWYVYDTYHDYWIAIQTSQLLTLKF